MREELAICDRYGIPHSEFLSWDEDDQDKAIWYQRAKAEICESCGTREEEWKNDPDAYVAELVRCFGCEVIETAQENVPKDAKGVRPHLVVPDPDEDLEEAERRYGQFSGVIGLPQPLEADGLL